MAPAALMCHKNVLTPQLFLFFFLHRTLAYNSSQKKVNSEQKVISEVLLQKISSHRKNPDGGALSHYEFSWQKILQSAVMHTKTHLIWIRALLRKKNGAACRSNFYHHGSSSKQLIHDLLIMQFFCACKKKVPPAFSAWVHPFSGLPRDIKTHIKYYTFRGE